MGKGKRVNLHLALALPTSDQDMVDAPSVVIVGMSCGEELSVKETAWYRAPIYLWKDSSCQRRLQ